MLNSKLMFPTVGLQLSGSFQRCREALQAAFEHREPCVVNIALDAHVEENESILGQLAKAYPSNQVSFARLYGDGVQLRRALARR
jgi:hypothetical protein